MRQFFEIEARGRRWGARARVCEVHESIWEEEDFNFESFWGFGDRFGSENAVEENVRREIGFGFWKVSSRSLASGYSG